MSDDAPEILFVCRHNAGRSQIAAGLARTYLGTRATVRSAGIDPAASINEVGAQALLERGIDIRSQVPQRVTEEDLRRADVIVTLVSGVELQVPQDTEVESWTFPDPAAWDLENIRPLVADIDRSVKNLVIRIEAAMPPDTTDDLGSTSGSPES